jgi:hypothetical protein
MISIFVDLLHPLPAPRGDPARLGTLSADPPLVVLLYSSCTPPPLRIILFSFSVTQGGAGSPPPLVEVNQAILAWSFYLFLCHLDSNSGPFYFRLHLTLLKGRKLGKLVCQHGSTFVSKREDSWLVSLVTWSGSWPACGCPPCGELERPLPLASHSQESSVADPRCIWIQLFTSMRVRIQGAQPMGIRIRILVGLCRHKKLDFDMKNTYRIGTSCRWYVIKHTVPTFSYKSHI